MKNLVICTAVTLLLHAAPPAAGEGPTVEALQSGDVAGESFLARTRELGSAALCALPGVRACLGVSEASCARAFERHGPRCIDHVRRLIHVTGVSDGRLNESLFADYAVCLMDGVAMARLMELDSARNCLAASAPALARMMAEGREEQTSAADGGVPESTGEAGPEVR